MDIRVTGSRERKSRELGEIVREAHEYLSRPQTIERTGSVLFPHRYPVQEGLSCVGNSTINALYLLERSVPARDRLLRKELKSTQPALVRAFQKITEGRADTRELGAVDEFLARTNLGERYESRRTASFYEFLRGITIGRGAAVLVSREGDGLVIYRQERVGHACMAYALKKDADLYLVKVDPLKGEHETFFISHLAQWLHTSHGTYLPGNSRLITRKA